MVLRHVWLLPVATVIFNVISVLCGYIIGVAHGHFPPILPYISNGGEKLPEAPIFAIFLNIASFFFVVTVYMRHRQIVEYYAHRLNWKKTRWYMVSLVFMCIGFASAIGGLMVANFRLSEMKLVHGIGAILAFVGMVVYAWGQTIIGYALVPRMTPLSVNHFRLFLVIMAACFMILYELASMFKVFIPKSAGPPPGSWQDFKWYPMDSPFFQNFVIAASAEWGMTIVMQLFYVTFAVEMRLANARAPHWVWKHSDDESEGVKTVSEFVSRL